MAQGEVEQEGRATHHEEEMPRVVITRRQAVAFGVFVLTVVGFLSVSYTHLDVYKRQFHSA